MPIDLMTARGEALLSSGKTPWEYYPRPQMRRDSYVNLNGQWDFTVKESSAMPDTYEQSVLVPFCPESQLSGLKFHPDDYKFMFYRRNFTLPADFQRGRVLLHFGAVDQIADIYVNQKHMLTHYGGYESFWVDITDVLKENNELALRVKDDLKDQSMPYGKQVLTRGGMWYTPTSGIWQSVWLESVPENYIQRLNIENRGYSVTISIEPALKGRVTVCGLGEFALGNGSVTITPENPDLWSPENPHLYDFTVETAEDKVESYFAIRSLEIKEVDGVKKLCLNGKPYFFHGLLDQGYWPDGLLTPAAPECYADDIVAMKEMGFNTLRKHIKVEPEQFYYDCDRLGMVVFQDMVNNGPYKFFRDTALPTAGFKRLPEMFLNRNSVEQNLFIKCMEATVDQLKNHPSICYWTIFNEGWGQFQSDDVFDAFKKLDDTRFVDATSGWFWGKKTDVDSHHIYFKKIRLKSKNRPLVLSEFGGYSWKPEGHVFNTEKTYGYMKFEDQEKFAGAVEKLYLEQVLPAAKKGLCAAVYTQVSDVEDETNGLLSYDRKVMKIDPARMRKIAEKLR